MNETKKVSVLDNDEVGCLVREEILKQDPDESEAIINDIVGMVTERLNSVTIDTISYWIRPKSVKSMTLWASIQKAHRENKYAIQTKL